MKNRNTIFLLLAFAGFGVGAKAQLSLTVGINQPPTLVADAGSDQSICIGDSVQLGGTPTGGTPGYTFAWTPNSDLSSGTIQDPMAGPSSTTTYSQVVTDQIGCTASSSVTVTVNALPTALFSYSANNLTVSFTDLSTSSIVGWAWDYGDGDLGTQQNPTHTYNTAGTYVACVTVTNSDGCEDTFCDTVNVVLIGVNEALAQQQVRAFPNPFTQKTQLQFELSATEMVQVEVVDLSGRLVWKSEETAYSAGLRSMELGSKELGNAAGVYVAKIHIGQHAYPIRLVKAN